MQYHGISPSIPFWMQTGQAELWLIKIRSNLTDMNPSRLMTSGEVLSICRQMQQQRVTIWLDGGWAVDALLGRQMRQHADVDIVIQKKDLSILEGWLRNCGYYEQPRPDTCPWNFVLGNDQGHDVDFHVIVLDEQGNGLYGPVKKGWMYPAGSLTGTGTIDGCGVDCISPEYLVRFHTEYEVDENDIRDVLALCKRFNLPLPPEYKKYSEDE